MARNSAAGSVGKGALGFGVGFALYFLIRNLRLGRGFGVGGRPGDEEAGRGPGAPLAPPGPPLPRDADPLLFVVFHPEGFKSDGKWDDLTKEAVAERARRGAVFHRIDLGAEQVSPREIYRRAGRAIVDKSRRPLSLDEVIDRVRAGSRDDVRLINMGRILTGTWEDVLASLADAGIKHWDLWERAPADRKPGAAPQLPRWDLYSLRERVFPQPNLAGVRYRWDNVGSAYWNVRPGDKEPPLVSGNGRGYYGRVHR